MNSEDKKYKNLMKQGLSIGISFEEAGNARNTDAREYGQKQLSVSSRQAGDYPYGARKISSFRYISFM